MEWEWDTSFTITCQKRLVQESNEPNTVGLGYCRRSGAVSHACGKSKLLLVRACAPAGKMYPAVGFIHLYGARNSERSSMGQRSCPLNKLLDCLGCNSVHNH
jgi:hypothetical protein